MQLAAICLNHQAELATDHAEVFAHTGVELINPWDAAEIPRWREEAAEYYVMSRKSRGEVAGTGLRSKL